MSRVVLRGTDLEIKLGLVFQSNLYSNHLQMTKCYPPSKGNIPTQVSSQILKPLFCDFLGSFATWGNNIMIAHLPHEFTLSPTHVELKIPTTDVPDTMRLSVMQFFRSIANYWHIGINKNMFKKRLWILHKSHLKMFYFRCISMYVDQ